MMNAEQQEQVIARLEQAVSRISVQTEQNSKDIGELTSAIKGVADKLDTKTGTNWSVIWSATAVVAAVVFAIAGGAWALMKAGNTTLEKIVQSYDMRLQRVENIQDREQEKKAKLWDNFVYQQVASGNPPTPAPASPAPITIAPPPAKVP